MPSLNALVEKVKLLDAGLEDWAIEMAKVLLLASRQDRDLGRVLLFHGLDGDMIRWVMFEESGARIVAARSGPTPSWPRARRAPTPHELQTDRAWAINAVGTMIADAN